LPVQATAADIAKATCIELREKSKKIPFNLVLFVHDEVVVECEKERANTISKLIEKTGLECSKKFLNHLTVPAEAHVSSQWEK
jgi:DNA polymerase-1